MANPAPDTREDAAPSEPPLISTTWCPWMDTSVPDTREDAASSKLPDIPKEFGQDNGEFYRHYDALAEKLDDNMVKSVKEQLEGLLIYAGLFAGVNSTFLALTLPLLSASPADDTNALLRENNAILLQIALNRNDSFPIASPLPSQSFSVSGRILTVNILFSISLTLALVSSLFAVLGRQWLVKYRSHSGSGADNQRRERISRYLGARGWGLEWLLGDLLPTLLQIGLILFGISLTIYVSTLHLALFKIVGAFMGAGLAFLAFTAIFAIWDPFCPFQTPLSRMITFLITMALQGIIRAVAFIWVCAFFGAITLFQLLRLTLFSIGAAVYPLVGRRRQQRLRAVRLSIHNQFGRLWQFGERVDSHVPRSIVPGGQDGKRRGAALTTSQVEAVARIICYSDDLAALMNAISNLLSIGDGKVLRRLTRNDQFCHSLSRLCRTSSTETSHLQGPDWTELAIAVTWRYRAAMARVALSDSIGSFWFDFIHARRSFGIGDEPGLVIPLALIKVSPPALINDYLAYVAMLSVMDDTVRPILVQTVTAEFEELIDSSWKRISIITACLHLSCKVCTPTMSNVFDDFKGEPYIALRNIQYLTLQCMDPGCSVHITSRKYLPEIFKSIGKAAIDSSGQSTIGIDLIVQFLYLSEGILRDTSCPAEFSPVARGLRRDLINALRFKCEENMGTDPRIRNDGSGTKLEMVGAWFRDLQGGIMSASREDSADMRNAALSDLMSGVKMPWSLVEAVGRLRILFLTLTAPDDQLMLMIPWNDDDLELVDLFNPVLQRLEELQLGNRFKVQVRRLRRDFENFTSAVNRVTQIIENRDRNPSTDGVTDARNDA